MRQRVFLTAEWRDIAMLNFAVDAALLQPLAPPGTELDFFESRTYVSLVGFRFLRTRVLGCVVPFHQNFTEVNLRFYVKRHAGESVRRGVVFVREIVPRVAVAQIARLVFHENYVSRPMSYEIKRSAPEDTTSAEYGWVEGGKQNALLVEGCGSAACPSPGTPEQFFIEHYWGYSRTPDGGCIEYEVAHPPWQTRAAQRASFVGDGKRLYGDGLAGVLTSEPDSALLADGSPVTVFSGHRIS
ncbi:MAG TPA: DUF2071 domain-containing protein [Bryobacteraceae bacterium]|nr:DUF2071 domain-containing protein [Bryobacteraceae bacterium]